MSGSRPCAGLRWTWTCLSWPSAEVSRYQRDDGRHLAPAPRRSHRQYGSSRRGRPDGHQCISVDRPFVGTFSGPHHGMCHTIRHRPLVIAIAVAHAATAPWKRWRSRPALAVGVQWHPEDNRRRSDFEASSMPPRMRGSHERVGNRQPGHEGPSPRLPSQSQEADAALAGRRASTSGGGFPGRSGRLLRRFAEAVDADLERLARLEVDNSGHTIATPLGAATSETA